MNHAPLFFSVVACLVFGSRVAVSEEPDRGSTSGKRAGEDLFEGPPAGSEDKGSEAQPSKPPIAVPFALDGSSDGESKDTPNGEHATGVAPSDAPRNAETEPRASTEAPVSGHGASTPDEKSPPPPTAAVGHGSTTATGRLEIETEPDGASISIAVAGEDSGEGEVLGETPARLRLPPGHYWVTLERDGYETAVAEVTVTRDQTAWLRLKMETERSKVGRGIRLAGHVLFWPGIVTSATGIALLVADDPKNDVRTGRAGFATAGVGVAMTVLGGIFLGVTYRDTSHYAVPVALAPHPDGRGASVSFCKTF